MLKITFFRHWLHYHYLLVVQYCVFVVVSPWNCKQDVLSSQHSQRLIIQALYQNNKGFWWLTLLITNCHLSPYQDHSVTALFPVSRLYLPVEMSCWRLWKMPREILSHQFCMRVRMTLTTMEGQRVTLTQIPAPSQQTVL